MAILQVVRGPNVGETYPLRDGKAVMGRHPQCDILIDVGAVSRQHAQIVGEAEAYFVEDLHSRNATFVNGEMVQGRRRLVENDRVRICDVLLSFHEGAAPELKSGPGTDTVLPSALMVDDGGNASTIMTTLELQPQKPLAVGANPEMKLKALLKISSSLRSTLSLEKVLTDVLDILFNIFPQADRGFVVLQLPDGQLAPMATKHRRPNADETIRISRTVVNKAMTSREAILSADMASDSRFDASQSIADFRIRSMICAPLLGAAGDPLGVIQIDTMDQRARFTQDDLDVLASVAFQAATAIENAQLHSAALEQETMKRDLELAHKVQQGILPAHPPTLAGYSFFDYYESAYQVGGDYYDYVPLANDRVGIVIADVSGKGIPAAMMMAQLSSEVRYTLATTTSPAEAMRRLNVNFCRRGWEDRFVSMVLCIVDARQHTVSIANAGHMAPRWRTSSGNVTLIGESEAGFILGVDSDYVYEEVSVQLAPGDSLTLFTDGISEAMNSGDEFYGLPRTDRCLSLAKVKTLTELGQALLDDVRLFVGNHEQSDDICLVCLGRMS